VASLAALTVQVHRFYATVLSQCRFYMVRVPATK
jgi:hypothetical protein